MADNQEVKTKRDLLVERMRGKYPDKDFADDEVLAGQISDDYDSYDKELGELRERERQIGDMFTADARSAQFLLDWKNGADPFVELVRRFGPDALQNPDKLADASKEFAEKVAEAEKYEEQYQANMDATLAMLSKIQEEEKLGDDDIDKAMGFLVGIMKDGLLGKFSPESVRMALKAIHHDEDVDNALHEGEVKGKNTKITEKLRSMKGGDGTADLAGKNSVPARQNRKNSVFDIARGA